MTPADLARALHDNTCHSYRAGTCDGGPHTHLFRDIAQQVITDPSPARALHTHVCDAEIDPTFSTRGGCPDRDRHTAHLGAWLEQHGISTQPVLELEGAP